MHFHKKTEDFGRYRIRTEFEIYSVNQRKKCVVRSPLSILAILISFDNEIHFNFGAKFNERAAFCFALAVWPFRDAWANRNTHRSAFKPQISRLIQVPGRTIDASHQPQKLPLERYIIIGLGSFNLLEKMNCKAFRLSHTLGMSFRQKSLLSFANKHRVLLRIPTAFWAVDGEKEWVCCHHTNIAHSKG
jgi:hypothetical protein